jgi:hypothetical protein
MLSWSQTDDRLQNQRATTPAATASQHWSFYLNFAGESLAT